MHIHVQTHVQLCGLAYTCLHTETETRDTRGGGREEGRRRGQFLSQNTSVCGVFLTLSIFADELLGEGAQLRSWKLSHSREGKGERGGDWGTRKGQVLTLESRI